jgi:hypothetical protein
MVPALLSISDRVKTILIVLSGWSIGYWFFNLICEDELNRGKDGLMDR